jgi:hypothetical protein
VSNTDRAHQNSEYVRRLLKKKQPEFAAVLERVVGELTCTCHARSAGRRAVIQQVGSLAVRVWPSDLT